MKQEIYDPVTGKTYSLKHLRPFSVVFQVKTKEGLKDIEFFVLFSSHCYTRSRKNGDSDKSVIFREKKRHGHVDERVFCKNRWEFSKSLPKIIQTLHDKHCLPGGGKELLYRQEKKSQPGSYDGWYICIRLGVSHHYRNLTLSVRSAHWRPNRPFDIRGPSRRFYALLARFYQEEKKKRGWL